MVKKLIVYSLLPYSPPIEVTFSEVKALMKMMKTVLLVALQPSHGKIVKTGFLKLDCMDK